MGAKFYRPARWKSRRRPSPRRVCRYGVRFTESERRRRLHVLIEASGEYVAIACRFTA